MAWLSWIEPLAIAAPATCPGAGTAVVADTVPPSVVYTWTTREQIADLQRHGRLLTRTESPVYGQTGFSNTVEAHAASTDHPASRLLMRPGYARHRYAWNQPWATAAPPAGERWGDHLIRIDLKRRAWVGTFDPAAPPDQAWRFADLRGRTIALEQVLAHPDRLAMVIFWNPPTTDQGLGFHTFFDPWLAYREMVVVNEAMVDRFAAGDAAIREVVDHSVRTLDQFAQALPPGHAESVVAWNQRLHEVVWRAPLAPSDVVACWNQNLAMAHDGLAPRADNARRLADRLRALSLDAAVSGSPRVRFSLDDPEAVPP